MHAHTTPKYSTLQIFPAEDWIYPHKAWSWHIAFIAENVIWAKERTTRNPNKLSEYKMKSNINFTADKPSHTD